MSSGLSLLRSYKKPLQRSVWWNLTRFLITAQLMSQIARLRAKMSQSSALHSMPWRSRDSGFCLATNGQWNETLLALLPFENGDFVHGRTVKLPGGKYNPHSSNYHARLAASQRGAWHRGYVWSPRVKRTKQLGDRVTVVGCLRGGASWVTVRILREDWGTLGNIRKITTPH